MPETEELGVSQAFVERLIKESLSKLEEEEPGVDNFIRWELGACWIQHLQDHNSDKDKKPLLGKAENEMKVEGLGKPFKALKSNKSKSDRSSVKLASENSKSHVACVNGEPESALVPSVESKHETAAAKNELVLKGFLSEAAFTRLKESGTGLHSKVFSSRSNKVSLKFPVFELNCYIKNLTLTDFVLSSVHARPD